MDYPRARKVNHLDRNRGGLFSDLPISAPSRIPLIHRLLLGRTYPLRAFLSLIAHSVLQLGETVVLVPVNINGYPKLVATLGR